MRTLNLQEAAEWLQMNPEVLRRKAKVGEIPAAKPGCRWIFLFDDLVSYVRSQYAVPAELAVRVTDVTKEAICHSIDATKPGGFASPHPTGTEYNEALRLKTA